MTTNLIQIENTTVQDFKNEIINGVIGALKELVPKEQPNDNDLLLTRQETAKILSISLVSLWDWTRKDLIPAYRIGGKVRYKKGEVLKSLIQKNKFE